MAAPSAIRRRRPPLRRRPTAIGAKRPTSPELGKAATPSFVETVGDVLDDLIRELRARGETVTQEAAALFSKVDAIKARRPKPA
jgi:hypothetical protein